MPDTTPIPRRRKPPEQVPCPRCGARYRLVGLEIAPQPGTFVYDLVDLGQGERSLSALPHDIVIDRCYVHGDPQAGTRRGVALNAARAGEDLAAVVTFHGSLQPARGPARPGAVKPAILVQTGGADPMIPKEQVVAFEKEMKAAGVDAQVVTYAKAKHSFTNPDADKAGMDALAYDTKADKESWKKLTSFLKKTFGT